ncbi:CYTH domain-containing protein [Sphingobium sp. Sx8-8]|uniref:CYTH domain-containing protein n=1 Tax=Sphingobium sp. Sx8-8 TaxID=2933617 RepID=UPI001F57EBB1|nr:CYTH domain-containing protein [Sphingobium sp. Sx8-8]
MAVEIERKFLVVDDGWRRTADGGRVLRQAYVTHDPRASVRVRLSDDRAWLTLKSGRAGIVRDEFEYEISLADAEDMLDRLCTGPVIEKTRYRVPHGGRIWEVDVFAGRANGLVLAEIELRAPDEAFDLPDWVGREVTADPRFRNSAIALVSMPDLVA